MTTTLDVLLIESHPGAGTTDADRLEVAGHRVHRCYPATEDPGADGRVAVRDSYLCAGVTTGSCPLDDGIDVALLVRQRLATQPVASEGGVSCALRAGVPVVEDGPDLLDPFEPWLAGRVAGDVAADCEAAAQRAFEPLRRGVEARVGRLLTAVGVDPAAVSSTFELRWPRLNVVLAGPAITPKLEHALAVRVLDAVRGADRTYGQVNVSYTVDNP